MERLDAMVADIRELVEIESPSDNKAAVDRVGQAVAAKFAGLGGAVRFHPASDFGNHLRVDFLGTAGKPVLLLGHYDTVYPLGTLASMPCPGVDGKITGPGGLDKKSGLGVMLPAIAALKDWHRKTSRPVTAVLG